MPTKSTGKRGEDEVKWRVCLECGNRFKVHGDSSARWCSYKCHAATYRAGRDQIDSTWSRLRWWLR